MIEGCCDVEKLTSDDLSEFLEERVQRVADRHHQSRPHYDGSRNAKDGDVREVCQRTNETPIMEYRSFLRTNGLK